MPVPEIFKRILKRNSAQGEPNNIIQLDIFQQGRILERKQTEPVVRMIEDAGQLAKQLQLELLISPPYCFLSSGSSSDPASDRPLSSKEIRQSNPARHQKLGKLIEVIDKIYGYYQEKNRSEMAEKVSQVLIKLTTYYLRDTTHPGTVTFTHHPAYHNPMADKDNLDGILAL